MTLGPLRDAPTHPSHPQETCPMRTLITNGTIVTSEGSHLADVLVEDETITAIGADLAGGGVAADETIDATGRYVIPGGIDVHTHMELPFGGTFAKDTFETGTRAAAFGGTTTIVDFALQSRGKSLREGLDAWHAKAEGNAVIDYGFQMIMDDGSDRPRPCPLPGPRGRGDEPRDPARAGGKGPRVHRPSLRPRGPRFRADGPRRGTAGVGRDVSPVPLPLARRPRPRLRGREV